MGHMVCDPCSCFLLLCILIVQLYQAFGPRNLEKASLPQEIPQEMSLGPPMESLFSKEEIAHRSKCGRVCAAKFGLTKHAEYADGEEPENVTKAIDCQITCFREGDAFSIDTYTPDMSRVS